MRHGGRARLSLRATRSSSLLQERTVLTGLAALTAIVLLIAMFTGSGWAILIATSMIIATLFAFYRPNGAELTRRIEAAGNVATAARLRSCRD